MRCKFRSSLWKGDRRESNMMSASRLLRKDFHNAIYFADCAVCRLTATIWNSQARSSVLVAAGCVPHYKVLAVGNVA
jgi:hypothetical protein